MPAVADSSRYARLIFNIQRRLTFILDNMSATSGISMWIGDIVRYMLGRVIILSSSVAIVLLSMLWQTTTPTTIGPLGILAVFILMYLSALGVLTFLIFGINKIIVRVSSPLIKRTVPAMTIARSYYFASVIALAPVMIIGMQSVGEVGIYELLLVMIFVMIACIYIAKRTN